MPDNYIEAPFPMSGVDLGRGISGQAQRTTPVGVNVRVFEPLSFRGRGGSRPGFSKFITQQLNGLIQELNLVVYADSSALPIPALDDPPPDLFTDPSTPGPPSSWGTGILFFDPGTGNPVTGATLGTRAPGDGAGGGRKVRNKGTGFQPNKNTLTAAPPPATPRGCFQGTLTIRIVNPPPDTGGFNGQTTTFNGTGCMAFAPPTVPAPGSAEIIPIGSDYLNLGAPPSMSLVNYAKLWLGEKVGSSCSGVVTGDLITDPSTVTSGGCSGLTGCSAAPPTIVPAASAVGTTITPA